MKRGQNGLTIDPLKSGKFSVIWICPYHKQRASKVSTIKNHLNVSLTLWGKTVKANKVKKDVDILRESRCNFRNSQFFAAPPLTSALPPLCPFPAQPVPLPSRPDFRLKTAQLRCNPMQCTANGQWSRHYAQRTASQPSIAHTPGCCAILQDVVNLLSEYLTVWFENVICLYHYY